MNIDQTQKAIRDFLAQVDPDPARPELAGTPGRVADAWKSFTSGYGVRLEDIIGDGVFDDPARDAVAVRDIDFYSICEHHLVPFFGRAHVAYLPDGRILGLSKMARIVEMFARRLQVQERMTAQIADAVQGAIGARGVAVIVEAQHLCMMMRGCERHNAVAVTQALRGELLTTPSLVASMLPQRSPHDTASPHD